MGLSLGLKRQSVGLHVAVLIIGNVCDTVKSTNLKFDGGVDEAWLYGMQAQHTSSSCFYG